MNSQRQINSINVHLAPNPAPKFLNQLEAVLTKFDEDIKSLNLTTSTKINSMLLPHLLQVLNKIPADSLEKLELSQLDPTILLEFLNNQGNSLKNLKVTGLIEEPNSLRNLKLFQLTLISPKCKLSKIIKSQEHLKYLKVVGDEVAVVDSQVLYEITRIKSLEVLDIPLAQTDEMSKYFDYLEDLKNLKSFSFSSNADFIFEFCNSTRFRNLQEIDVSCDEMLHARTFDKISECYPRLQSLSIRAPMALKYLNYIANKFMSLKSLLVENIFYTFVGINQLLLDSHAINSNLKKLTIINHDRKVLICSNDIFKLIQSVPNVSHLVLSGNIDTQKLFKNILQTCSMLKELVIKSPGYHPTTYLMYLIKDYGSELDLIVLQDSKTPSEIPNLKIFFEDDFSQIKKVDANLILRKRTSLELFEYI